MCKIILFPLICGIKSRFFTTNVCFFVFLLFVKVVSNTFFCGISPGGIMPLTACDSGIIGIPIVALLCDDNGIIA